MIIPASEYDVILRDVRRSRPLATLLTRRNVDGGRVVDSGVDIISSGAMLKGGDGRKEGKLAVRSVAWVNLQKAGDPDAPHARHSGETKTLCQKHGATRKSPWPSAPAAPAGARKNRAK